MKQTRTDIMGMPITVEVPGHEAVQEDFDAVFLYFQSIDERFSTYKKDSEISRINRKEISASNVSPLMREIFQLADATKSETNGYFDIKSPDGLLDPSGLVKGWAIHNAAEHLEAAGVRNYYIEAGGDIQVSGVNENNEPWLIGIRSPFNTQEIVKRVRLNDAGIATSGAYIRGAHIYNPHTTSAVSSDCVSISVIGSSVYDADRFATAAFAMGTAGISFIESLDGFEGYSIDKNGIATFTSGFQKFVA